MAATVENEVKYYLLYKRVVGKSIGYSYFLYRNGEWVPDEKSEIRDCLIGYDPFEPSDSPYCIGNTSIMDEVEEITYEKAMELIGE